MRLSTILFLVSANWSVILFLISTYAVLLSAIYLFDYWDEFNLNIYGCLSLNDILTNAIPRFLICYGHGL